MNAETLIAFCIASFLLALSPGPGVMATVGRAVQCGVGQALVLIVGLVAGDLVYLYLAFTGLTMIALVMGEFFFVLRLACAAYLCWLGWKMLRQAGQRKASVQVDAGHSTSIKSLALGFGVSLGNPKAILFYVSFVPTFVDVRTLVLADTLVLSGVVLSVSLVVLGAYAVLASHAARFAVRSGGSKRIDQLAGVTLIGAGTVLAIRSRS